MTHPRSKRPTPEPTAPVVRLQQLSALCWELLRQADSSQDSHTIKLTVGTNGTKERLWRLLTQH